VSTAPASVPVRPEPVLRVEALGRIGYEPALARQEALVAAKLGGDRTDYLLLLEHDPVYTLGRGADAADLCGAPERLGVPVFRIGRGGGATYHGPGQLVAYPILGLAFHGRDVHRYVRRLEDILIAVCAAFGVRAEGRPGQTGVWVGPRKIASIGIGVRRWVTLHGVALNVATDLRYFGAIVPCATPGQATTSLSLELGRPLAVGEVAAHFVAAFRRRFGYRDDEASRSSGAFNGE
jgi:lipoate-protein ligase B